MAQAKPKGQHVLLTGVLEGESDEKLPTLDEVFGRIKADLGGERELKVKVERVDSSRGKPRFIYCDAYALEEVSSEDDFRARIREEWGGGVFRLWCHDGKMLRLNRQIEIAERKNSSDAVAELRNQLAQFAQQQRPPAETEEAMLQRMKLYKDLFAPTGGGSAGSGGLGDFLRGVEFARASAGPGAGSPVDMVQQVLKVVDGARALRSKLEPEQEGSLVTMGVELLKTLGLLAQNTGATQPQPLPTVAVPRQLADHATAAPAAPQPEQSPQMQAIREAVQGLNVWAKVNGDPEAVAELVYERLPDELVPVLSRPDWFEVLVAAVPEAKPFEKWYRATHAELMQLFADDAAESEQDKTPPAPAAGAGK